MGTTERLRGKVAIITGATSGIGRACAERFIAEGASVALAGRRRAIGEALAAALGERALFVATDVTCDADLKALVERTTARFGGVDCLISNAGATSGTGSLLDTDPAAFDRDWALHVRAAFVAIQYAAPAMIARGGGSVVCMSSISGRSAGFNAFGYEVAKAALAHLARCAALELGEKGVRVNCISPGPVMTGIFGKAAGLEGDAADRGAADIEDLFLQILPAVQASPGMVKPEDIAAMAAFLASDDARFVNGQDVAVDGGITAGRPAAGMKAAWQAIGSVFHPA